MQTTANPAIAEPRTDETKACCQVRPTAINEEATFQPAIPNIFDIQNNGILYQVHVRSCGGVGSRSLLDHFVAWPSPSWPSGAGGALMKSMNACLDENGSMTAAL